MMTELSKETKLSRSRWSSTLFCQEFFFSRNEFVEPRMWR